MEQFTKDIWRTEQDTVQACKYGRMEQNMRVSGDLTKQTEKENSGMLTAMCTKANGKMTKQTDSEFMNM